MHVTYLILRNFRNYEEAEVSLIRGVNRIQGKNGAGKTSLLEALYLLSTGRSFLTTHLTELIRKGTSYFYIEAHFIRDGVEQVLGMGFDGKQKRIHYNHTHFNHFSHVLGILPSVLYSPKDSGLISGSPQERRRFLNIQLAQTDPLYVHYLLRYHKAMQQRNVLLRNRSEMTIASWEKIMAEAARYLMQRRSVLIDLLRPKVEKYAKELSGEAFQLYYDPSINESQDIETLYQKHRKKEFLIGTTLSGPHRDDLKITYRGEEAKTFASEGQKRTCIAALKLAEWEVLAAQTETIPLLSIDDFGVHLDTERTKLLEEKLMHFGQVFLTTPYVSSAYALHIENGKLLQKTGAIKSDE